MKKETSGHSSLGRLVRKLDPIQPQIEKMAPAIDTMDIIING